MFKASVTKIVKVSNNKCHLSSQIAASETQKMAKRHADRKGHIRILYDLFCQALFSPILGLRELLPAKRPRRTAPSTGQTSPHRSEGRHGSSLSCRTQRRLRLAKADLGKVPGNLRRSGRRNARFRTSFEARNFRPRTRPRNGPRRRGKRRRDS